MSIEKEDTESPIAKVRNKLGAIVSYFSIMEELTKLKEKNQKILMELIFN